MKKISHQIRVSIESDGQVLESPKGRLFFDDTTAQFTDLSGVRILRCGVDTVRQLYNGKLRPEVMALFDLSVDVVEFAGYEWSKGRIGRDSGYQYRLQNAEMGLILLIKNHNIKVDTIGSHLKIEVSPHALDGADPRILQGVLDDLAAAVLSHCETNRRCAYRLGRAGLETASRSGGPHALSLASGATNQWDRADRIRRQRLGLRAWRDVHVRLGQRPATVDL